MTAAGNWNLWVRPRLETTAGREAAMSSSRFCRSESTSAQVRTPRSRSATRSGRLSQTAMSSYCSGRSPRSTGTPRCAWSRACLRSSSSSLFDQPSSTMWWNVAITAASSSPSRTTSHRATGPISRSNGRASRSLKASSAAARGSAAAERSRCSMCGSSPGRSTTMGSPPGSAGKTALRMSYRSVTARTATSTAPTASTPRNRNPNPTE